MLPYKLHPIKLSDIDFNDRTYCLTPWDDPPGKDLIESIQKIGVLAPPILISTKQKKHTIVSGRKRIEAVQQCAPDSSIYCYVLPTETDERDIFTFLLEEKIALGTLSTTEQVIFFDKLHQISSKELSITLLEKCGLKPQEHTLVELLKLSSLDVSVLKALHTGILQKKNAKRLLKLPTADQTLLVQIISNLNLGGSKQQKIIELSSELIKRKKLPLKEILNGFPLQDAKSQPDNTPQYSAALLTWLKKECFPRLCKAEKTFQQKVKRLDLPASIRISHATSFENDAITVSLQLPDWDALESVLADIKKCVPDG